LKIAAKGVVTKFFPKTACGWHGLGYVGIALENGRSVFPV
jgi:hypothetical protein